LPRVGPSFTSGRAASFRAEGPEPPTHAVDRATTVAVTDSLDQRPAVCGKVVDERAPQVEQVAPPALRVVVAARFVIGLLQLSTLRALC
jgi:hypothetical protein